jgi:thymidylate synthase (FAD)
MQKPRIKSLGVNKLHDRFCWNVMSARYSIMPDEKWTGTNEWRSPSSTNKQAGDKPLDINVEGSADIVQGNAYTYAEDSYNELLEMGVCREQARSVLPMGQYTEAFVTANLGDWMLFLRRRMDSHAQMEIQVYANAIYEVLSELFPTAMQAFIDYQHGSVGFSRMEMNALKEILSKDVKIFELKAPERVELLERHGLISKRERVEFIQKIK